eukprot:GHUV01027542.1.p1 GENE.GHUV01027542.1~~GHUV01027542.1.p1  ORF type:complete len:121 (-),score=12.91 GHUV01027542.1:269-631(-)
MWGSSEPITLPKAFVAVNSGCIPAASSTSPVPPPTTATRTLGCPAAFHPSMNTAADSGDVHATQSKEPCCSKPGSWSLQAAIIMQELHAMLVHAMQRSALSGLIGDTSTTWHWTGSLQVP